MVGTFPAVTIIVLNWNGRSLLSDCLNALLQLTYPNYEIIVVDNGSTDDSIPFLQQHFPQIALHLNGANLGFGKGNNQILHQLQTPFAALVNTDVIVSPNWLTELINPMLSNPKIGLTGSKLYYPNGRIQHAGGFLSTANGMPGHFGIGEEDHGQFDTPRFVDYLIGAALAIRKETIIATNGFDEQFFLYYEDTDLCWSARKQGYLSYYAPQSTAVHIESASTGKDSDSYLSHFHTSRWYFLGKHLPFSQFPAAITAEQRWFQLLPIDKRPLLQKIYHTTINNFSFSSNPIRYLAIRYYLNQITK